MLPVQITMRDIPSSPAIESLIRKRAEKLTQFYDRIISCRVVIELPQKHKHQGKLYNVKIDVSVPGKELVASRKYDQDIRIAIRDAFQAIERQLEEHSRKCHGQIKSHSDIMYGHVVRMMKDDGYGFIKGVDGNEYYFSLTNVSYPRFDQLSIGDSVEYLPETFSDGRHALRVTRGKRNQSVAFLEDKRG